MVVEPTGGYSTSNQPGKNWISLSGAKYDYKYPDGLDLRPDSEMHQRLKDNILDRALQSQEAMTPMWDRMREVDKMLTLKMPLSEQEKLRKIKDSRTPVSIVVPMAHAQLETLLTYWTAVFLQPTIWPLSPQGPEDTLGTIKLEKILEWQTIEGKIGLALHTMGRDAFAYGFGPVFLRWKQEWGKKNVLRFPRLAPWVTARKRVDAIVFEGNEAFPVDPYLYLPDPNVSVHDIQNAEYVAWIRRENLPGVLSREQNSQGEVFNARYCKHISGISSLYDQGRSTASEDRLNDSYFQESDSGTLRPVDVISMYVNLIPAEWELGTSEYPEKWLFELAGDEVIIAAHPLDLDHGKFPGAVAAPDFDGHSLFPTSRMETIIGLNHIINFLFNSHMANISKSLRNMILVDPMKVNLNDVMDTSLGMIARLRREYWGQGVKDVMEQFPVVDATKGNMMDVAQILQFAPQVSGVTQSLQGIMRQTGEANSATEARDTRMSALSRMERAAKVCSIQAIQELGEMCASHTQQFMTQSMYTDILGRWEETLVNEFGMMQGNPMRVDPYEILVNFDVKIHDGTIPKHENANEMLQLFQMAVANPFVAPRLDHWRMFKSIARRMGISEIDEFQVKGIPQLNMQVVPDEQVAAETQKGNMVPV